MPSPTATTARISIERRFDGPLTSANGGYACGHVARFVDGPAAITLRRPVPLDTPLDAERHDDGSVTLHHDGVLLAEGEPALPLDLEPPRRPSVAEARHAGTLLIADATLPHEDGCVVPEIAWAALDRPPLPEHTLASMTAEVLEPIELGTPVVAVGWSLGGEGREQVSASALLAADGTLLARARALWIRSRS